MNALPRIALGAWAWGNDGTFGNEFSPKTLRPIFETAMENGLNLWDTAYAYGMGTSEKTLAGFLKGLPRDSYLVSDKFTPQCVDAASPTGRTRLKRGSSRTEPTRSTSSSLSAMRSTSAAR